jgi:hypothetical protein
LSDPTPLHPDADLALVLDDLRQSVAASGDEGLIMRVFVAGIRLALISILDTLISLLADFRAGRLPPVLPAYESSAHRRIGRGDDTTAVAAQPETPPHGGFAARHTRASGNIRPQSPCEAGAEPGQHSSNAGPDLKSPCLALPVSPSRRPIRFAGNGPRIIAGHPSHVPRPAGAAFRAWATNPKARRFCYDIGIFCGERGVARPPAAREFPPQAVAAGRARTPRRWAIANVRSGRLSV